MIIQIEMFKNKKWCIEIRYYNIFKPLDSFDLHDVDGKRRNAKYLKQ